MKLKLGQKYMVSTITLILDILLIYILLNEKLNIYDKSFVYIVLVSHFLFYISVYNDNNKLMELCHITIPLTILFGIFTESKYILGVLIIFIIQLYITWFIYGNCPIKHDKEYNAIYILDKVKKYTGIDFHKGDNIEKYFRVGLIIIIIKIVLFKNPKWTSD